MLNQEKLCKTISKYRMKRLSQARATLPKELVQHNIFPYKCNNLYYRTQPDKRFLKTLWLGKKNLITNIYYCSCMVSYPITSFTIQSQVLTTLKWRSFENIVGNRENTGNQHILLFPE